MSNRSRVQSIPPTTECREVGYFVRICTMELSSLCHDPCLLTYPLNTPLTRLANQTASNSLSFYYCAETGSTNSFHWTCMGWPQLQVGFEFYFFYIFPVPYPLVEAFIFLLRSTKPTKIETCLRPLTKKQPRRWWDSNLQSVDCNSGLLLTELLGPLIDLYRHPLI